MKNTHPRYTQDETQEYYFEERCHILEIMNSPNAPQLSIARARVEAGVSTVLHTVDRTEVYYILRGSGVATIGNREFPVGTGEALYIAPGTPQRITNHGSEDLIFLAICTPRFTPQAYQSAE